MRAARSVDELDIDPHSVPTTMHRAFEDITHIQITADPFHVERLALVGEGRVARDHERTGDPRQIRRKTFGDTIDEIFLLGVAAYIGKGQNNDGETRCRGRGRSLRQPYGGLRWYRPTDFERIGPDGLGDVL